VREGSLQIFSRRESELIKQYLHVHGEMPGGGEDDGLDAPF